MIELPVCRYRYPLPSHLGRYECTSPRLVAPNGVTGEFCRDVCANTIYCNHDLVDRSLAAPEIRPVFPNHVFGSPYVDSQRKPLAVVRNSSCVFEGAVLEWCPTCSGELKHVRECEKYGKCTRGEVSGKVQACSRCDDYALVDPDDFSTRHLLYHLYPVSGNGSWQRNLNMLIPRLGLFTGRKIIAVAVDPPTGQIPYSQSGPPPDSGRVPVACDSFESVCERLSGVDVEIIRVTNDPNFREVVSFKPLFEKLVESVGPNDVTLYAHAKGTTRYNGHPAHEWTDVLYEAMLDYWPVVAKTLGRHPLAGCFLKRGPGWRPQQSRSDWHYSGSWFWFRNADLYKKPDWSIIDQFWSGIEPYPSQHFTHDEAGVVFFEGQVPHVNLYHPRYWQIVVRPAWAEWKRLNFHNRTKR